MLNIAICEDEVLWQDHLLQLLKKLDNKNEYRCHVFSNGEEFLREFEHGAYDLIFMDIYMSGMSGVETVTAIRKVDEDVFIAFVTSSLDHTLEGYRLNVMKYLEKPIKERDVVETLSLADMKKRTRKLITLTIAGKEQTFPQNQILYLEQRNHTIHLCLSTDTSISFTGKLDDISSNFPFPPFYRCHKSYLVNLAQVASINRELQIFVMQNQASVYIRRGRMKEAETVLNDYIFSELRRR